MRSLSGWLAPTAAAFGVAAFAVVFAIELRNFRRAVLAWAERDLDARAAVAAEHLREPLETADFGRIQAFGASCAEKDLRLTVFSAPGGLVYDSRWPGDPERESLFAERGAGEYRVRLGLAHETVLAPFRRARFGFALAAVLGGACVLAVFFFTYRQRVRMRELRRLERFRRDFVADLSHEIKTPLTGILGAAELLGDFHRGEGDGARPLVEMLRRETARLDTLVKDILALARLERGEAAADFAATDLAALVRETAERFRPRADAAGVALALAAPSEAVVTCDARLVERALSNLVANALVHARARRIEIALSLEGGVARMAVADDGVGMPPEASARAFERFYRADPSRSDATGGSGLGLSIVRGIARLHGGDATVSPNAPTGCRFELTIPTERKRSKS